MKFATLGALAAGFGLASLSQAQTATESQLPAVRAKATAEPTSKDSYQATTTRIGKGEQDVRDVAQSLTVVTEKLIDDRNLDTLKETLKNTAGITFQAAEGGEEDIRLRGFPLQSTGDVFVDGMRDPAFYDRDTFFYDRIELLRGSASLVFGRGSTGGAVNMVTKQPRLLNQNQVDATLGSHGYARLVGDFNVKLGDSSALRIGTMKTKADNDGAGSSIDKQGLAASYRWGIGERDEIGVVATYLDNDNGINYGMPWIKPSANAPTSATTLLPLSPTAYYGMASDYNRGKASMVTLSHTHRFDDRSELTTKLRRGLFTRDLRASTVRLAAASAQPGGLPAGLDTFGPATVLTRGTQLKIQDVQTTFVQSDYQTRFKLGGMNHELLAGVDLSKEAKQVYSDSPNLSNTTRSALYAAEGLTKANTTVGTGGGSVDESRRRLFQTSEYTSTGEGMYAQDLIEFLPGWKALVGLRYDHLVGDYTQQAWTYSGTTGTHGYDKFALGAQTPYQMKVAEWSKRLGLLWQPTERWSMHLSSATSFNTSGDAYSLSAGNKDVPPEQSINTELGLRWEAADGQFSVRSAVFRSTKLHERNTDPDSQLVTLSGKRHVAGFELDLTGRITKAWEVWGSYMWLPVAKIDQGVAGSEGVGTRPSLTPRHSGSIWTTYQLTPKFRFGGGLNARSSQQPNRNPGYYAPKFVTGDLMAEYTPLPDQLSFKLNVTNVSDKLYADALYPGHYIPGEGRTVQLTASFKF